MIPWLQPGSNAPFPPIEAALRSPNGLLCAGADLSVPRLLAAYRSAIFPWFSEDEPPLWWSPDPRMVLQPSHFHAAKRLLRSARTLPWHFAVNQRFEDVLRGCAAPRDGVVGTWLHPWMIAAYSALHHAGFAHSVEIYLPRDFGAPGTSERLVTEPLALVGGCYGVGTNGVFFAESMFSAARDASKIALLVLCRLLQDLGCELIDCQMKTEHLARLGAVEIPRSALLAAMRPDGAATVTLPHLPLSALRLLLHSAA